MAQKRQITKKQLINLINSSEYLPSMEKKEWLGIVDILDQKQMNMVFDEITESNKKYDKYSLYILVKKGKGKEILSMAKGITNKFKKRVLAKKAKYLHTEERPEDILSKLNEI